jgi:hypothetical protein
VRQIPVRGALAGGLHLSRLRQAQSLAAANQAVDPGLPHGSSPWTEGPRGRLWECAGCGKQTSVTAGTIMHHSKLPLTIGFWAADLMATHSNGIAARQRQCQLALGSCKTAWLRCAKLRRSMVAPGRSALAGLGEIDETAIACRSKHDPVTGGGGRSHQGKMLIPAFARTGAVEVEDGGAGPGRIPLAEVPDYSADSLHPFIAQNLAPGATAKTEGWSAYPGAPGVSHDPHVVGQMAAHVVLPWVHRIFANLKSLPRGPLAHGLDPWGRPGSGPWASITACAAGISNPTSTRSSSASTAAAPATPPAALCSASPPATHPSPTKC